MFDSNRLREICCLGYAILLVRTEARRTVAAAVAALTPEAHRDAYDIMSRLLEHQRHNGGIHPPGKSNRNLHLPLQCGESPRPFQTIPSPIADMLRSSASLDPNEFSSSTGLPS